MNDSNIRHDAGPAERAGLMLQGPSWLPNVRTIALLFAVAVFGFNLALHWDWIFDTRLFVYGDDASNDIRIFAARSFDIWVGNYSRWGFSHPGPYFWYVYAFSEWLFLDVLRLVSGAPNAHVLGLLVHQSALFGVAVFLLHGFVPSRPALIAAGLLMGGVLTASSHAWISHWPPHQFILAFTVAILASARVASGSLTAFPVMVVTLCICVHSHVAQILFAGPLFVAGCGLYILRERPSIPFLARKENRVPIALGLVIAVVFAAPILLDPVLERGNVQAILHHMQNGPPPDHSLKDAVLYNFSFATFWGFHDEWSSRSALPWVRENLAALLPWALVVAGLVSVIVSRATNAVLRSRVALISGYLAGVCLLACYWALRQNGALFSFNSFFVYGVLALWAGLSVWLFTDRRLMALGVVAVALFGISLTGADLLHREEQPLIVRSQANCLAATHEAEFTRMLQFVGDRPVAVVLHSDTEWPAYAEVVARLVRQGAPVAVDERWSFLFVRGLFEAAVRKGRTSEVLVEIGSFGADGSYPADAMLTHPGRKLWLRWGAIDRSRTQWNASEMDLVSSLSGADSGSDYVLVDSRKAVFEFWPPVRTSSATVLIDLEPFHLDLGVPQVVRSEALKGGEFVLSERQILTFELAPQEVARAVERGLPVKLQLEFPTAVSPKSLGLSPDERELSVAVRSVKLETHSNE